MDNILVTGGAGFIGSNFIRYMLRHHEDRIVNFDKLTYAGNPDNLSGLEQYENYHFVQGDICNRAAVEAVFSAFSIDRVVNFAAESHVDRSIENPKIFLTTNVLGTQVLLDVAKEHWHLDSHNQYGSAYREGVKFLQVSTDEVYGALGAVGLFTEATPLSPNSPYSASKASADFFVRAYHETYGLPINITRSSNNYGPYQFPEKLIPLMINNCKNDIPLPVYGDGMQVRDWLHVSDHCSAIEAVLYRGKSGEIYNVGGGNERTNIQIVKEIIHMLGRSEGLIQSVADRPGHDRRYAMDYEKITTQLGWKPACTFEAGLAETINWYLSHSAWSNRIASGVYRQSTLDGRAIQML